MTIAKLVTPHMKHVGCHKKDSCTRKSKLLESKSYFFCFIVNPTLSILYCLSLIDTRLADFLSYKLFSFTRIKQSNYLKLVSLCGYPL